MHPTSFVQEHGDGVLLSVKVQPRSSRDEIIGLHGTELKVRITAPPVDAAANEALVRFLADRLGVPRGQVRLVRGALSRHKTVQVLGLSAADLRNRLGVDDS